MLQIRSVLETWQQRATFSCGACESHVGLLRDTISNVCDLGPSGTFVNAYGCMHSITCVCTVTSGAVVCLGHPTTEFSWFPRYAWTTAMCKCGQHLGWRFTRVSGTGPEEFWGLAHSSLDVSSLQQGGDVDELVNQPVEME